MNSSFCYFESRVVAKATERARSLGAKVLTPKTEVKEMGRFTVIDDPTGARLALWEPAKK
jgi:predicted enzyme related to lactoylglutathione lyase